MWGYRAMGCSRFAAVFALAAGLMAVGPAWANKKVALVVGNAAYSKAPLRNPVNDARAMARQLRAKGFDVLLRENVTKTQFADAVADFGEKLAAGDTALFFYAGHGLQVQGRNYLLPVDARITNEQRVRLEAMDVEAVLDQTVAARASVSMLILDACRNNPFERRFRSTGAGLAHTSAPEGTLIAYATAPGKVAADGEGTNGLYTQELLKALAQPGLKVEEVFKQVRINVARASDGAQVPWEASSLTGDFFFIPPPPSAPAIDREAVFWETVKGSTDIAEFRAYLDLYAQGTFAPIARARIASIEAVRTREAAEARNQAEVADRARREVETANAREREASAMLSSESERARQAVESLRMQANRQTASTAPVFMAAAGAPSARSITTMLTATAPIFTISRTTTALVYAKIEDGIVRITASQQMNASGGGQNYRCVGLGPLDDGLNTAEIEIECFGGSQSSIVWRLKFEGTLRAVDDRPRLTGTLTAPNGVRHEIAFR